MNFRMLFSLRTCMYVSLGAVTAFATSGCKTAGGYRQQADKVAYEAIEEAQEAALSETEPFTIERPEDILRRRLLIGQELPYSAPASLGTKALDPIPHWPEDAYLAEEIDWENLEDLPVKPVKMSLMDALMVGARNSRDYQNRKEQVYLAALDLDLERDFFRPMFAASNDTSISWDLMGNNGDTVSGIENTSLFGVTQNFKQGARLTSQIGLDLVRLLTQGEDSARGLFADATVTVPLLRGAGKHIVTEPLTQAERDVVYAIHDFERFKRTFAVQVASTYLQVLRQLDEVTNAEQNYKSLVLSGRRARRLADAGRLPEIQVDQALQDELRARDRWIGAQQAYEARLDSLKLLLGLPTDSLLLLDREEFERMASETRGLLEMAAGTQVAASTEAGAADAEVELIPPSRDEAGPYEIEEERAIRIALDKRLDLRTQVGEVYDAQRKVYVAADLLKADVTLGGSGSIGARRSLGSAGLDDSNLKLDEGFYEAFLNIDLPLERTAERNIYRQSLIALERAVRNVQDLEDQIKADVRESLRTLLESRESLRIQAQSVELAKRRVVSTDLFLQAGRAEIRDLLEAQEDLISAQNALTSAIVNYRVAELELQRDLGILEVNEEGLWEEPDLDGEQL